MNHQDDKGGRWFWSRAAFQCTVTAVCVATVAMLAYGETRVNVNAPKIRAAEENVDQSWAWPKILRGFRYIKKSTSSTGAVLT